MAITSEGIKLYYKKDADYVALTNLQSIPELGGSTDAIEITTLTDGAHMYTDGIKSYGNSLAFTFLFEKEQFTTLNVLGEAEWKVELPDATTCTFGGSCSVKLAGVGVNTALTYTLEIKPNTEMVWA